MTGNDFKKLDEKVILHLLAFSAPLNLELSAFLLLGAWLHAIVLNFLLYLEEPLLVPH